MLAAAVENMKKNPEISPEAIKFMENFHKIANDHYDIIKRFGRFPHRNEVLARESTVEEVEYLLTAQRFGQ